MSVTTDEGLVLRVTPLREHDLIVDLYAEQSGRLSAVARGARRPRSTRAAVLEVGARVSFVAERRGEALATLGECSQTGALNGVRQDLNRYFHLVYVVELARLALPPTPADPIGYRHFADYLDRLERGPACLDALTAWELELFAHLGYRLQIGACVRGGEADALSLAVGGSVDHRRLRANERAWPLTRASMALLREIDATPKEAHRQEDAIDMPSPVTWAPSQSRLSAHGPIRAALRGLWAELTGHELRTADALASSLEI